MKLLGFFKSYFDLFYFTQSKQYVKIELQTDVRIRSGVMKGVIYARYSSDNQREESIEGQLRECNEFAKKNGIQIIETYIDRALSAKTDNRPDFQRMIKDSESCNFEVVIVWKLDRFARNRYDSAHYKAMLRKRTGLRFCLQLKEYRIVQRVSFWNLCLRVWQNTTRLNSQKRLSAV